MNRREYLKHFAVLFTGTVAAQLLNLASYPILARIYSPADFGVFATFVASAAIPSVLACGRFELAVPTAPNWGRFAILWLCLAVSVGTGLISAVGSAIYWLLKDGAVTPILPVLFGLCVFLSGFCAAGTLYLMRHNYYRMSSASVVMRTGGAVATQLLLGLTWKSPLALIIGFATGLLSQALLLAWSMWTHVPPRRSSRAQVAALFRRYRRQVSVDIPSAFIAAVSLNLLTLLLANLYGQKIVGYYALAQRIAILPLQLFNDSLSQIFFQKAARAQEERGHFWNEMRFNLLTSGALSVGMLVLIFMFARPLTKLYLGPTWGPAADMLVLLAPMLAMRSLTMSIATAVFVVRRAHWLFAHNIANASLLILAYLAARTLGLGIMPFLTLAVVLLTLEYAIFALFLGARARMGMTAANKLGAR
jgi:O-antigen/teichoic acid export membrane protein